MTKVVVPKVFIIAETSITSGLEDFLAHLGVPDWHTDATSDAELLCEVAGKSCYLSFSTKLNKNLTRTGTRNNHDYLQQGIIATKHGSVLEHATVTLAFMDVSRILTHELVRHRPGAAYSQVSGRYVRTDQLGYFIPKDIVDKGGRALALFDDAFKTMEGWVQQLETIFAEEMKSDFALKKKLTSAFRRVIGNGAANHIIATFNHRTLRHLIEQRTSRQAEEEIRIAFNQVFQLVKDRYPAIYADANVENVDGLDEITFIHSKV